MGPGMYAQTRAPCEACQGSSIYVLMVINRNWKYNERRR